MRILTLRRRAALLLGAGALAATAACNDFLSVSNPGAIEEPDVNNPAYTGLLVSGVLGEFQPAFTNTALYSGVFTDELSSWHGFSENTEIDRRDINLNNGTYNQSVYTPLQSSRFMADSATKFIKRFLGAGAASDVRVARTLAYAGYSYLLLGEQFCEAPIDMSRAYTSDELLGFALDRFNEAMTVATAAPAGVVRDSLLNLARVGAARTLLDLNRKTEAAAMAAQVPANFSFWVYHTANTANGGREQNPFFGAASNGPNAEWVGITNTPFRNLGNDPRIPHPATTEKVQQDTAMVPNAPLNFSNYTGTATGADFLRESNVRFASGLEAQYIVAEAQGTSNAANVTFINQRRAIGGQAPLVAPTEAEFQAALREQRGRDLYLANYRLGDLRRWKRYYSVDLFPSGTYRGPSTITVPPTFGTQECWPIPLAERNANPNL